MYRYHRYNMLKNKIWESATSPVYWFLWGIFRLAGLICFNIRFHGQKEIPNSGRLLVAGNHASILDIPFLGCGINRRLSFIGRHNLFPIPVIRPFLQRLGWIPIRQDRIDRRAFRVAEELLMENKAVVIFPEGSRTETGAIGEGRPGLARLVARTGCKVLPVYISGTFEALPMGSHVVSFNQITVIYGQALDFSAQSALYSKRDFYRHVTTTVMKAITELALTVSTASITPVENVGTASRER